MAKMQVRNNEYYEKRLQLEHPIVYADLQAGKYRTVSEAAIAVGLKQVRTRLHELKNSWSKATTSEQAEFLRYLVGSGVTLPPSPVSPSGPLGVAVSRKLTPASSFRIRHIMAMRQLKPGDVMSEMGFSRLNASVGMALARGTQLNPDVVKSLEQWLAKNSSV